MGHIGIYCEHDAVLRLDQLDAEIGLIHLKQSLKHVLHRIKLKILQ